MLDRLINPLMEIYKWKIVNWKMKPIKKLRKKLYHVKENYLSFSLGHPRFFLFWGAGIFIRRYDFAFF